MRSLGYSGLCVGGPHNGKMMENEFPVMRVPLNTTPTNRAPAKNYDQGKLTVNILTYKHIRGIQFSDKFLDFWVPENRDGSWAIEQIIAHYTKTAGPVKVEQQE